MAHPLSTSLRRHEVGHRAARGLTGASAQTRLLCGCALPVPHSPGLHHQRRQLGVLAKVDLQERAVGRVVQRHWARHWRLQQRPRGLLLLVLGPTSRLRCAWHGGGGKATSHQAADGTSPPTGRRQRSDGVLHALLPPLLLWRRMHTLLRLRLLLPALRRLRLLLLPVLVLSVRAEPAAAMQRCRACRPLLPRRLPVLWLPRRCRPAPEVWHLVKREHRIQPSLHCAVKRLGRSTEVALPLTMGAQGVERVGFRAGGLAERRRGRQA